MSGFGVFLFAIYRLVPQLNTLNGYLYGLEGSLPHLLRTYRAIDEFEVNSESTGGSAELPDRIGRVTFDDVSFSYETDDVLKRVSFSLDRNERIAFVGPSGARKSTIVSLLSRMYEPDAGRIEADGTPIDEFESVFDRAVRAPVLDVVPDSRSDLVDGVVVTTGVVEEVDARAHSGPDGVVASERIARVS